MTRLQFPEISGDVSDHYHGKPHGCLSIGWMQIFDTAISNANAASIECERLLTSECAEMPFIMHKLAVDLKVCREVKQVRGINSHPAPFSQGVADDTEFLEMLLREVERMPQTVAELSQLGD